MKYDVAIIGSGVAGMTAAIYLKRANVDVVIIEKNAPGGQINKTAIIENYPGFSSIEGPNLAMNIYMQINDLEIPYKGMEILEIVDNGEEKIVKGNNEDIICKKVIIATGRKPKSLDVPNEDRLNGKGISWCAICDGALFKNKDVLVIGGGNSALEESLYLASLVNKVTMVHRRDEFTGDEVLKNKVLNNEKIEIIWNTVVEQFNERDGLLESVAIKNKVTDEKRNVPVSGSFIFIGFEPETKIFENLEITDKFGYILVDKYMETSKKGIYACGDVIRKELYQIVTAMGEGAQAAMSSIMGLE